MASEKKKLYDIEIPLIGEKVQALASSKEKLAGQILKLDMTRMLKGRNMDATLAVTIDDKGVLYAHFTALKMMMSYIKRMMRKNISWIEDSFVTPSTDGKLEIKPYMITKKRVHRSVRRELRNKAKEFLVKFAAEKTSENFFDAVLRGSIQKEMSSALRKVYPLAFCEIRMLKIKK